MKLSRRTFLLASSSSIAGFTHGMAARSSATEHPTNTDSCFSPTPAQIEGPFFTPNSPERRNLLDAGLTGQTLTISGRILNRQCQGVSGAQLEVWQCDQDGRYDNRGFRLRGHQFVGLDGAFSIQTIKPAAYPLGGGHFRTPHIHIKVQGEGTSLLTTQLYFPGEPLNARDAFFDESLVMEYQPNDNSKARIDIIL